MRAGLGGWSVDDIVEYLKTGANAYAAASGPMAEEVMDSTSYLTLTDLRAIATYLKDQPSSSDEDKPMAVATDDPQMRAGQAIYQDQCAACHTSSGSGIARMFPSLKGNPSVQSSHADSVLQVILNGTRAVATEYAPTGPAMPAFAWKLSDDQVAAVATFVRNAWGNNANPVAPGEVKEARQAMAERQD